MYKFAVPLFGTACSALMLGDTLGRWATCFPRHWCCRHCRGQRRPPFQKYERPAFKKPLTNAAQPVTMKPNHRANRLEMRSIMSKPVMPHDHGSTLEHALEHIPDAAHFEGAADIFQQLCDGSRLRILWLLCHCEDCVVNIAAGRQHEQRRRVPPFEVLTTARPDSKPPARARRSTTNWRKAKSPSLCTAWWTTFSSLPAPIWEKAPAGQTRTITKIKRQGPRFPSRGPWALRIIYSSG